MSKGVYSSKYTSIGTCFMTECSTTWRVWCTSLKVQLRARPTRTLSTDLYALVPAEEFMDYVPDVAAFKKLDFKNAASYICKVRCP
jgi:hypothetical protein